MEQKPIFVAEYAAFRAIGFLLAHLPYRLALGLGWLVGAFVFFVVRYRVSEAHRRIRQVFPDRYTTREVRRIAWSSWQYFCLNTIDVFRLQHIDQQWIDRHIVDFAPVRDALLAHCRTGQGAIIASPHMGASEVSSVVLQKIGVPIFLITGTVKNPQVNAHIIEMRGRTGIPTVQRGSSLLKSVIHRLKGGGFLAFLADLRARWGGTIIHFLGHTTAAAPGMAKFAKQTGVPIIPITIRRVGWTRHRLTLADPVVPNADVGKAEDCVRMTQEVFDVVEGAIRETPEQWFWFNKRWILDPPNYEKTKRRP
jgi:KDO2-lipid IV(A) lauroyltransferase